MMARSRVYRPEISCPECGSHWMRKNGFTNGAGLAAAAIASAATPPAGLISVRRSP